MKRNSQQKSKNTNNTNDVFNRLYKSKTNTTEKTNKPKPPNVSVRKPNSNPKPSNDSVRKPNSNPKPPNVSIRKPNSNPKPPNVSIRKPNSSPKPPNDSVRKPNSNPKPLPSNKNKPPVKEKNSTNNNPSKGNATTNKNDKTVFDRLYKRQVGKNQVTNKKPTTTETKNTKNRQPPKEPVDKNDIKKKRPLKKSVSFKTLDPNVKRSRDGRSRSLSPSDKPFVVLSLMEGQELAESIRVPSHKTAKEKEPQHDDYAYESDFESDDEEKEMRERSYIVDDKGVIPYTTHQSFSAMSLGQLSRNEEFWENYPDNLTENPNFYDPLPSHGGYRNQERQAAGHDSGRTRLHLLNEREKQKGIFTVKEERNAQPGRIRQIDYDEDNSGIYRAKTHSREAVNEINDSEETSIELPFDARCAEEIKDEEIAEKPHKIRKELNSNSTVSHLDTMSASEPSLEVDFEESSHTDNTFVRETKTVKKSVSEEREHSAGRERKQGGSRLKRGTTTRDSTILDDDQRTIRWPFNKLDLHSALFETGKNMIPDPRFLSNAEQKTTESSKESSKFIQYKGDFIENSEISIDTSKKTKSITASGQGFSKLPVANAKLNKNEYPLNEGQSTISSLSEKTITEKPSHLVHYSNRAKNTSLKKKTPREIETSTVTYSPKSTTTVGDDDESNFLTSRFSMMSMSGPTMAETDISDISSRDDFTLLPDFSEYASRDFQNRNATKDSSPNTGEFSRPGIPYNKLNNCASYLDDRSLDFTLPHITEEYEAMKASTSALSLTLNSEGGSQTVNSETTYLSNRSHSSRSENTNSADYLSTDDSHYNLEEKENLSSSKYNNFKFNNKIRSNVFSIPHLL